MLIKWLGHSCFKITLKDGRVILIDPFDNNIGYESVREKADFVLISHDHYDHSYVKEIKGDYKRIDQEGLFEMDGLTVRGVSCFHDDEKGRLRGRVIVFTIQAEGVTIMHLSDIGAMPDETFFKEAGHADILMVPVGGVYTIDEKVAFEIMEKMKPNVMIPMHYMTSNLKIALKGVHEFLALAGKEYDVSRLGGSCLEISADTLKKRQRVIVMDHAN